MSVSKVDLEQRADAAVIDELKQTLERQRQAFLKNPAPSYEDRIANLKRLQKMVLTHKDELTDAVCEDFGSRSRHETILAEIMTTVNNIKYTRKRLHKWMRPRKRHVDVTFQPAKAKVIYQPKGVVGIVSPWNYPVQLALVPLATALGAGNRAIIKPSEITPKTSEVMKRLIAETFSPEEVHVVTGGPDLGAEFSGLPWDHLFFTGSTQLGRLVMKAAAENLTPVTLELGGKSPLIVHKSYPVDRAAKRIVSGKYFNGGQTCVAPDYILVHESKVDSLVNAIRDEIHACYPTIADNRDYTAVVNERHYARLQSLLKDAQDKGATVVEINPANEKVDESTGKIPPTVLLNTNDDMSVMQDEIFGPLLPILPYDKLDEALDYVNQRPRPLALYYFDDDASRADMVLQNTVSGGACINETVMHVATDDLPFGGVGDSGLGAYHGYEGFETFSHKKAVLMKGRFNSANMLAPPYGPKIERIIKFMVG